MSGVDKLQDYGSTYATGTATHHLTLYRDANGASPDALVFGARHGPVVVGPGREPRPRQPGDGPVDAAGHGEPLRRHGGPARARCRRGWRRRARPPTRRRRRPRSRRRSPAATVEQRTPGHDRGHRGRRRRSRGRASRCPSTTARAGIRRPAARRGATPGRPPLRGPATIRVRAADDSGNLSSGATAVGVTVTGRSCPCSLFGSLTPADTTANDGVPIEVGVKFRSDEAGTITALRYYKGAGWTGTRTGHLWTAPAARRWPTVQFTGESASGWQQAPLSPPVRDRRGHDLRRVVPLEQRLVRRRPSTSSPPRTTPRRCTRRPAATASTSTAAASRPRPRATRTTGPTSSSRPTTPRRPPSRSVAPADGSAGVPAGTQVSATFDEPLRASSVTGAPCACAPRRATSSRRRSRTPPPRARRRSPRAAAAGRRRAVHGDGRRGRGRGGQRRSPQPRQLVVHRDARRRPAPTRARPRAASRTTSRSARRRPAGPAAPRAPALRGWPAGSRGSARHASARAPRRCRAAA